MSPVFVAELSEELVERAAAANHPLWGDGRSLADHQAHVREQLRRARGSMRYAGLIEDGELVSSCKRYELCLRVGEEVVAAHGIGAVFTPEGQRRRGLAATLLEAALDERPALLFSDIAPGYYARLGFHRLAAVTRSIQPWLLPARAPRLEPCDDAEVLVELHNRHACSDGLSMARTVESHRYWSWRGGPASSWLVGEDGYVSVCPRADHLWVDDAAVAGENREALWGALRALASHFGLPRVAGWLPDELADERWQRSERSGCVPMVRGIEVEQARFWSVDAF